MLILSLAPGCATTKVAGSAASSLEQATFSVDDRQYTLDACSSGDLGYFLGVDLADRQAAVLVRLVIDPMDGPRVRLTLGGHDGAERMLLGSDQCRRLEGEVKPTGWWVNTVRDVSGFLDADCRSEAGRAIRINVRFSHCH